MTTKNPASSALFCPLWRRLLALLYDLLAVLAIVMVVGLLSQLATGGQVVTGGGSQVRIAWWYQPLQGLAIACYFLVSWLRGGQTLGMRPWRLRLTTGDGGAPTAAQALLRLAVAALPLLLLALAPIWSPRAAAWAVAIGWAAWFAVALVDSRRRTLHDLVARTELRRIG